MGHVGASLVLLPSPLFSLPSHQCTQTRDLQHILISGLLWGDTNLDPNTQTHSFLFALSEAQHASPEGGVALSCHQQRLWFPGFWGAQRGRQVEV